MGVVCLAKIVAATVLDVFGGMDAEDRREWVSLYLWLTFKRPQDVYKDSQIDTPSKFSKTLAIVNHRP